MFYSVESTDNWWMVCIVDIVIQERLYVRKFLFDSEVQNGFELLSARNVHKLQEQFLWNLVEE